MIGVQPNYQRVKVSKLGADGEIENILHQVLKPLNRETQRKGLLGYRSMDNLDGMLLADPVVHMVSMKIPLDLVFLTKANVICKISRNVKPGFKLKGTLRARGGTLELAVNAADDLGLQVGDQLFLEER